MCAVCPCHTIRICSISSPASGKYFLKRVIRYSDTKIKEEYNVFRKIQNNIFILIIRDYHLCRSSVRHAGCRYNMRTR